MKMEENDTESNFDEIVETLMNTFGEVLNKDVVYAVVESFGGDLNQSANAIMSIISEVPDPSSTENPQNSNQETPLSETQNESPTSCSISISYAQASQTSQIPQRTGAIPKATQSADKPSNNKIKWSPQMRHILDIHRRGIKVLILMRGVPGSGKSYLARRIIEFTLGDVPNIKEYIYSTDDFFTLTGKYHFERHRLSEAHYWNQNRVRRALEKGISPVIVDNTNVELWEMDIYVKFALFNKYSIEVVEPNTPWAKKASELARRNIHDVPIFTIRKMLSNYDHYITSEYLRDRGIKLLAEEGIPGTIGTKSNDDQLCDRHDMPRNNLNDIDHSTIPTKIIQHDDTNDLLESIEQKNEQELAISGTIQEIKRCTISEDTNTETDSFNNENDTYKEIQKHIEHFEEVERAWEDGENWEETIQNADNINLESTSLQEAKPPRKNLNIERNNDKLLPSADKYDDWKNISMFMPSWNDTASSSFIPPEEHHVETRSSGTCMEKGDTEIFNAKNPSKIISATPRDINYMHFPFGNNKIPKKSMLDKSTFTNMEDILIQPLRCKNEEKHFVAFRKMFKNLGRSDLREIFDKCCGDVNWAVEIVLDGVANDELTILKTEHNSDSEEEDTQGQCECVAAYDIIPSITSSQALEQNDFPSRDQDFMTTNDFLSRKPKKETAMSESSLQLKRQIEQNVVIADNHYSAHCLRIRKLRRGEIDEPVKNESEVNVQDSQTQLNIDHNITEQEENFTNADADCSDDDTNMSAEAEKTVNFHLGAEFVAQLDSLFGRKDMVYPDNIVPKINIPLSLLNEINAIWMESLMYQIEEQNKQLHVMMKQDEDFARELAQKEAQLAQEGKEPAVPDFKEIMDMDFALSLYQKDVSQWRKNIPNDMAAKFTRDKLKNLFPEVAPDILNELLMAHDNNFQATVEVLLSSTGRHDILEEEDGLKKFVMSKEIERQGEIIQKESEPLSQEEWPFITPGVQVDMEVVQNYRKEAQDHLEQRDACYQKAQYYIGRGMTTVALYYSDGARFHTQKIEQAQCMAAASIVQMHAFKSSSEYTLDLHFLRVAEAMQALDMFLDVQIQKMKEAQGRLGRYLDLYFITGRGLHSNGSPKIKPATRRRLRLRKLGCRECNPGLLCTRVTANDKLSYEIALPSYD